MQAIVYKSSVGYRRSLLLSREMPRVPQLWWTALLRPRWRAFSPQCMRFSYSPVHSRLSGRFLRRLLRAVHVAVVRRGRSSGAPALEILSLNAATGTGVLPRVDRDTVSQQAPVRNQPTRQMMGFLPAEDRKTSGTAHHHSAKPHACPHSVPVHFVRTPSGGWLRPALLYAAPAGWGGFLRSGARGQSSLRTASSSPAALTLEGLRTLAGDLSAGSLAAACGFRAFPACGGAVLRSRKAALHAFR